MTRRTVSAALENDVVMRPDAGADALPGSERTVDAPERAVILVADPGADAYMPPCGTGFDITLVSCQAQAIVALEDLRPALVITELELPEGDGIAVCRRSKALMANPPCVLVTTAVPERVPDALIAGCDGVLLKPFPPNLLFGRLGRLLRQRGNARRERAMWQRVQAAFPLEHSGRMPAGTNIVWRDAVCPSCGEGDAVGFDAASYRRMWYACLACRNVWVGRRREVAMHTG
jgi:DNA-binding response OmpR family regulator